MAFTLTPAAPLDGEAVVPLDLAREYLKRLDQDEDQTIRALRDAAIGWVERYSRQALSARSFVWVTTRPSEQLMLSMSPVRSVTSVEALATGGAWGDLSPTGWSADAIGTVRLLRAPIGAQALRVVFIAGFDDASVEAPALVSAVLALMAHLFANRGNNDAGEVPTIVKALCEMDRTPVIA